MSQRCAAVVGRNAINEQDQLATVCVAHLPDKIKKAIHAYGTQGDQPPVFVQIVFKNGYKVSFRRDWKEFAAECILVYDLPPVETDDG